MRKVFLIFLMMLLPLTAEAKSGDKKRAGILEMGEITLTQLYAEHPSAKQEIADAEGYAVFSNVGVNVVFFSAGGGKGFVHDNDSGENTYMKMASAGVGIGLGVKDFRAIFVFSTRKALNNFIDKGWDFSGQADAAAQSSDKGGEGSAAGTVLSGVNVYQITKNGFALQATLQGTKYWKDKKLNRNK
jgi:lipid-binding SYLF domain-containing protein